MDNDDSSSSSSSLPTFFVHSQQQFTSASNGEHKEIGDHNSSELLTTPTTNGQYHSDEDIDEETTSTSIFAKPIETSSNKPLYFNTMNHEANGGGAVVSDENNENDSTTFSLKNCWMNPYCDDEEQTTLKRNSSKKFRTTKTNFCDDVYTASNTPSPSSESSQRNVLTTFTINDSKESEENDYSLPTFSKVGDNAQQQSMESNVFRRKKENTMYDYDKFNNKSNNQPPTTTAYKKDTFWKQKDFFFATIKNNKNNRNNVNIATNGFDSANETGSNDLLSSTSSSSSSNNTIFEIESTKNNDHQASSTNDEPYAILIQKENSCPFIERRISLGKQVKVGRAIGKTRPSVENAVFDCKVLSRNHAVLWYQDGKFFLKDTCSSNGTFVNNIRLSSANEKSQPHELFSGDCIQFGVEVTEKKNVHSCVIATIRLFLADDSEAKPSQYASECGGLDDFQKLLGQNNFNFTITPSQLIQLEFFVKDSARKQSLLENQLESMRQVMSSALTSAKQSWVSMVQEDQLLSRIQTLQSKLEVCLLAANQKKDSSDNKKTIDALMQQNFWLIADKEKFETANKKILQQALEEKTNAIADLQTTRLELTAKFDECQKLNDLVAQNLNELKVLADNCDKMKKEKDELLSKLKKFDDDSMKIYAQLEKDKIDIQQNESNIKQKLVQTNKFQNKPASFDAHTQTIESDEQKTLAVDREIDDFHSDQHWKQTGKANDSDQQSLSDQKIKGTLPAAKLLVDIGVQNAEQHSLTVSSKELKNKLENAADSLRCFSRLVEERLLKVDQVLNQHIDRFDLLAQKQRQVQQSIENKLKFLQSKVTCFSAKIKDLESVNNGLLNQIKNFECALKLKNEEIEKYKCDIEALNSQVKTLSNIHHESTFDEKFSLSSQLESSQFLEASLSKQKHSFSDSISTQTDLFAEQDAFEDSNQEFLGKLFSTIQQMKSESAVLLSANSTTSSMENGNVVCDRPTDSKELKKLILDSIAQFRDDFKITRADQKQLIDELKSLKKKLKFLSYQNELSFCIAIVPLFAIVVAFVFGFYPILSYLMGTSG